MAGSGDSPPAQRNHSMLYRMPLFARYDRKKGRINPMKKLVFALALLIAAAAGAGSGRLSAFCCPEEPPPLCPPACDQR
mgnify:CR=1 FL=1